MHTILHRKAVPGMDCLIKAICGSLKPEEVQHTQDMLYIMFGDYDFLLPEEIVPTEILAMHQDTTGVVDDWKVGTYLDKFPWKLLLHVQI